MVKWFSVQIIEDGECFVDGIWGIFGYGNVVGLGEVLEKVGDSFLIWCGQNE